MNATYKSGLIQAVRAYGTGRVKVIVLDRKDPVQHLHIGVRTDRSSLLNEAKGIVELVENYLQQEGVSYDSGSFLGDNFVPDDYAFVLPYR
jgi:hypothetical protein